MISMQGGPSKPVQAGCWEGRYQGAAGATGNRMRKRKVRRRCEDEVGKVSCRWVKHPNHGGKWGLQKQQKDQLTEHSSQREKGG
jgi:hypothetical protein